MDLYQKMEIDKNTLREINKLKKEDVNENLKLEKNRMLTNKAQIIQKYINH